MPTRNANNNSRDCIVKVKAYCFDFFKCNVLQIRFQLSIHMCIDIREPFFFFWKSSIFSCSKRYLYNDLTTLLVQRYCTYDMYL